MSYLHKDWVAKIKFIGYIAIKHIFYCRYGQISDDLALHRECAERLIRSVGCAHETARRYGEFVIEHKKAV